ncbi:MAG TPA: ABC transporter permease [Dehalococcoidia bacterium]|nr:ABC transporter permease [Dehalococcoidia bacterium]
MSGEVEAVAGRVAAPWSGAQGRPWFQALWRFARREPLGFGGGCLLALILLLALCSPIISRYDPLALAPRESFIAPGNGSHWLGTDHLGRDLLSRVLYGGRASLGTAGAALLMGAGVGTLLGLVSGYSNNLLSQAVQRCVDAFMALPPLILALAIAASMGSGVTTVLVAMAVVMVPSFARVVRGTTLSVASSDYVMAAATIGATPARVLLRHVVPNIVGTVITLLSIWVGNAILVEAALGFLGVGIQPPHPTWGNMLANEGRSYMLTAPWLAIVPGAAITATVLCSNLLGDAVRTTLDPRLRFRE